MNNTIIKNKHLFPGNFIAKQKGFDFFNPIFKVILVISLVGSIMLMLIGLSSFNKNFLMAMIFGTTNVFLFLFFLQLYLLLPAWIAWGRGCKYKEFILATTLFIGPMALIWAIVGEKEEK